MKSSKCLLIPVDSPIGKNNEKHSVSSKMEETFIRLHNPLVNLLMGSATERRVRAHFAIAKLKVSALANIEWNRPVSRYNEFALAVAERIVPRVPAGAPIILLSAEKVNMRGIITREQWKRGRPVFSFFVMPWLA